MFYWEEFWNDELFVVQNYIFRRERKGKEKKRKESLLIFLVSISYNQGILLYHIEKSPSVQK